MIVVVDTNVLLAAVATRGVCEGLLAELVSDHRVVLCEAILAEFAEHYAGKFGASADAVASAVQTLRGLATFVEPAAVPPDAGPDPDDLMVLGTALAASADAIVTGDRVLTALGSYSGIPILTPRQLLALLRRTP